MEELTKKELLDYLEEISQQLNNIALDQIPFAISELYFKLENSIPISVIENEIEELSAMKLTDTIAKAEVNFAIVTLEDIIYEERRRNNTDEQ